MKFGKSLIKIVKIPLKNIFCFDKIKIIKRISGKMHIPMFPEGS